MVFQYLDRSSAMQAAIKGVVLEVLYIIIEWLLNLWINDDIQMELNAIQDDDVDRK